jgi:ketosteroid isomerase-like protein
VRAAARPFDPWLYVLETRRRAMDEPRTVRLVQQLYTAALEDDLEGFLELCALDAEWVYPEIQGVSWSRAWRGHEEIVRWAELHDDEDEVVELRPEEYVAQGDRVVVLGFARMRTVATSRRWETRFVHAVRIRDGKVARFEAYFDTAACVEAHGLVATA